VNGDDGSLPVGNAGPLVGSGKEGAFVSDGKLRLSVRKGPERKAVSLAVGKPLGKPDEGSAAMSVSRGSVSALRPFRVLISDGLTIGRGIFRDFVFLLVPPL